MVKIDGERLISEKQNNKVSAEGARLPKAAMIFTNLQSQSWTRLVLLDSSAGLAKSQEIPPNSINGDFYKNNLTQSTRLTCRLLLNEVLF